MAEDYLRQSALAGFGLEARAHGADVAAAGVRLCERAPRRRLVLRGDATAGGFASTVGDALGVALPVEPNTSARRRDLSVLWLGPDEWLVQLPKARGEKVVAALETALAETRSAVVDVSHARVAIGVAGPRSRDVLAKGCSLDLHPRGFGTGRCAQTVLARCHALLHQLDDEPAFDVIVARSFADYAWRWLEDAAGSYGVAVEPSRE